MDSSHPVILFDGVCNLCNASVQFIINRDPKAKFRFTSLQSDAGQIILKKFNLSAEKLYSVIVVDQDNVYDRSRAALEIARRLSGLWPLLYGFILVPPFIRNFVYDWISRNRYRWFGVRQECMMPTPNMKARFI
jgi:predicted DCC family thiol-disulfide oxidoreductase YuxK